MKIAGHALLALDGWIGIENLTTHRGHWTTVAAGAVMAAGASALPDLDEPNASAGYSLPFGTGHVLAHGVKLIARHHRGITHSLLFTGLVLTGVHFGETGAALTVIVCLLACFAAHIVRLRWWSGLAIAAALLLGMHSWSWLPLAVGAGLFGGIGGDCLTPHGCPLLWPWKWCLRIPLFKTGSPAEQHAHWLLFGLALFLLWLRY